MPLDPADPAEGIGISKIIARAEFEPDLAPQREGLIPSRVLKLALSVRNLCFSWQYKMDEVLSARRHSVDRVCVSMPRIGARDH